MVEGGIDSCNCRSWLDGALWSAFIKSITLTLRVPLPVPTGEKKEHLRLADRSWANSSDQPSPRGRKARCSCLMVLAGEHLTCECDWVVHNNFYKGNPFIPGLSDMLGQRRRAPSAWSIQAS